MIPKYHNQGYTSTVPTRTGDRRYSQDRIRDFWFGIDRAGIAAKKILGTFPICLSGGVVTQGAGQSLNITIGYGFASYSVEIPNSFASSPPTKQSNDLDAMFIDWSAKNSMNIGDSECATYDVANGATVWYVKVRYYETDGLTRARAKATGTYSYEKIPARKFYVDADVPTGYDICLATLTSAAGTYTITSPYTAQKLTYDTIKKNSDRLSTWYDLYFNYEARLTEQNGGMWCDYVYKDADEIVIKCKGASGVTPFIGAILNDGKFLKLTSDYTIKLDVPGSSGHIIDWITAKLNNEIYLVWAYEDSGGLLAFGITWSPNCLFSNANPTNSLTLEQINAQDIGYLFNVGAGLFVWQDTDEWESIYAWQNTGAVTYDPTKAKPVVSSRGATTLTLGANLENNNFITHTRVFQLNNFKPLAVDDGLICDVIGARGYKDTGFRIVSTAAGAVQNFYQVRNKIFFANGSGAADYDSTVGIEAVSCTNAYVNYLLTKVPPDKKAMITMYGGSTSLAYYKRYYDTYGSVCNQVSVGSHLEEECNHVTHKILSTKYGINGIVQSVRGYILDIGRNH